MIIEGPGHVPLDEIEMNVKLQKKICDNAPFYVLGPLITDIALGYDHISSAIGGAVAAMHGADFLCYVTPSEHLGLPTISNVKEGVIASKIAAHAANLARGLDTEADLVVAKSRKALDWEKQFEYVIDPDKAKTYRAQRKPLEKEVCSMCGELCAIKIVKDFLQK